MNDEKGEPWISQTTKMDWEFTDGALYFKHWLYVPELACHDLVKSLHELPTRGHEGSSALFTICRRTIGGLECLPSSESSSQVVLTVKQPR